MSISKSISSASVIIAAVGCILSAVGLLHELSSGAPPAMLIHELEGWVVTVGYHAALIVLAASVTVYLAAKKP